MLSALRQVTITLDVEDQGNAEFWKEFNPEAWATAEAAGMRDITRCAAPCRCVVVFASKPRTACHSSTNLSDAFGEC